MTGARVAARAIAVATWIAKISGLGVFVGKLLHVEIIGRPDGGIDGGGRTGGMRRRRRSPDCAAVVTQERCLDAGGGNDLVSSTERGTAAGLVQIRRGVLQRFA